VWPAGALFSRAYGTLVHGKRVPVERIVYVVASLAEGLGIRAVARVFAGGDPNTVLQWLVETADHLHAFSQYFPTTYASRRYNWTSSMP